MKKLIIITSIAIVSAGSIAGTVFALNQSKPQESQVTTSEAPQTPSAPEPQQVSNPTPEAPQEAPAAVQEPIATTPTNEDLVVQYGWTKSPYRSSIDGIIGMVPQFFTEDNREASFAYLENVCSKLGPNISYCFTIMIANKDKAATWIRLGKQAGADTSRYE